MGSVASLPSALSPGDRRPLPPPSSLGWPCPLASLAKEAAGSRRGRPMCLQVAAPQPDPITRSQPALWAAQAITARQ